MLRIASNFTVTLAPGAKATYADAVKRLLKDKRRWEVRSAGQGSRASAGTPGPGSRPARRAITSWSAAI